MKNALVYVSRAFVFGLFIIGSNFVVLRLTKHNSDLREPAIGIWLPVSIILGIWISNALAKKPPAEIVLEDD